MNRFLTALTTWWLRAEPHVMGRAAVAVVVTALQVPAIAQMVVATSASAAVDDAGPNALAYVWSSTIILAGVMVAVSYRTSDPEAERVLEVAALVLVALVCSVYVAALVQTSGAVGALYILATLVALIVNCLGRAILLTRQIFAARRLEREALAEEKA
jgi:O-antigen ligase